MHIILIPGLWLDGSSWDEVVPVLEQAGHRAHPITLPGMEAKDAERSNITLDDQVESVVSAIDSVDPHDGKVVLVGHSAGSGIAYAAIDARPERVARAIYIGGFPTGDGNTNADPLPAENGEIPLPDWSVFEDADLAGLDDAARAEFRERAIPSPERVTRDLQRLRDERRYDVPVTVICTEFTSEMLRGWIQQGARPVAEFTRIPDVEYIDLPTGHWPQFTRPDALGWEIITAVAPAGSPPALYLRGIGRPEPPLSGGDEVATLLGSLERQRATFAWKSGGLGSAGLRKKLPPSTVTLGGLLKHLAFVEEVKFSVWLRGQAPMPPFDTADWEADPDWDWHSAADDTPEQLYALWRRAVSRSRATVAEALAQGGVDQLLQHTPWDESLSLRRVLADLIEEYARHVGHADLIRESVDGLVGEDPPD